MPPNVITLRTAEIVREKSLQTRPLDAGTVAKYQQAYRAGAPMPPVIVARINSASLLLVDGWHRFEALERSGIDTVAAEVVDGVSIAEARWLAMKANLTHGLPLKQKQRQEAFRAFMLADQWRKSAKEAKSLREIGQELGASHNTIRSWMLKDFKRVFRDWYIGEGDGMKRWRNGGARAVDGGAEMVAMALRKAEETRQAFRGITEPDERATVIAKLVEVLAEMKGDGEWKPWEPEPVPEPEF